jgi:hypothetical protein
MDEQDSDDRTDDDVLPSGEGDVSGGSQEPEVECT